MRKRKIIVLYEDGSYRKIKEEKFQYSVDMTYLLIPDLYIEDKEVYIPIEATPLLEFKEAHIELVNYFFNIDFEEPDEYDQFQLFSEVDQDYTSIIDLINMIHSLTKMDYVNELYGSTVDSSYYITSIRCCRILLDIFDNNGNSKFHIDEIYSIKDDDNCVKDLTNHTIIKKLSPILHYLPHSSDSLNWFIMLTKHGWKYEQVKHFRDYPKDVKYGICFDHTHTVYFTDAMDVIVANFLRVNLHGNALVLKLDDLEGRYETADEIEEIYSTDSYLSTSTFDIQDGYSIMELYMYLSYIVLETKVIAEYFVYEGEIQDLIHIAMRMSCGWTRKYRDTEVFVSHEDMVISFNENDVPSFDALWGLTTAILGRQEKEIEP